MGYRSGPRWDCRRPPTSRVRILTSRCREGLLGQALQVASNLGRILLVGVINGAMRK